MIPTGAKCMAYNCPQYIDKKIDSTVETCLSNSNMLNGNAINELKLGLSSGNEDGQGHLRGKSYAEVAHLLSIKFEIEISSRSVRHYVKTLERQNGLLIVPPSRGRPRAAPAEPDTIGAWGNEIRRLTGLSASEVHSKLKIAGESAMKAVGKSSFHKRLAHLTWTAPVAERSPRAGLINRCCLRMHTGIYEVQRAKNYWVVLAGYEQETGFLSLALFEVLAQLPGDAAEARPGGPSGRPKVVPNGAPSATILIDGNDGYRVELAPRLLHEFYNAARDRIGLPINRLWLSQSILASDDAMQELRTGLPGVRIDVESSSSQPYVRGNPPSGLTLGLLSQSLSRYATRYNASISQPEIDKLKAEVQGRVLALNVAKRKWGPHIDGRRTKTRAVDVWLDDYYRTNRFFDTPVNTTSCKVVRAGAIVASIN